MIPISCANSVPVPAICRGWPCQVLRLEPYPMALASERTIAAKSHVFGTNSPPPAGSRTSQRGGAITTPERPARHAGLDVLAALGGAATGQGCEPPGWVVPPPGVVVPVPGPGPLVPGPGVGVLGPVVAPGGMVPVSPVRPVSALLHPPINGETKREATANVKKRERGDMMVPLSAQGADVQRAGCVSRALRLGRKAR